MAEGEIRTRIVRIYAEGGEGKDEEARYWVDLEVVEEATFFGAQFPGIDYGNLPLETLLKMDRDVKPEDREDIDHFKVQMFPETEQYSVNIPVISSIEFRGKRNSVFTRKFHNQKPEESGDEDNNRRITVVGIASNGIADEFLQEGKQPPSNPDEYRNAVRESDDLASLWLDVAVSNTFRLARKGTSQYQHINFASLWGELDIDMPGVEDGRTDGSIVITDPYCTVINFGPESLAVEFVGEAADGGGDKPDGGGPPPDGAPPPGEGGDGGDGGDSGGDGGEGPGTGPG